MTAVADRATIAPSRICARLWLSPSDNIVQWHRLGFEADREAPYQNRHFDQVKLIHFESSGVNKYYASVDDYADMHWVFSSLTLLSQFLTRHFSRCHRLLLSIDFIMKLDDTGGTRPSGDDGWANEARHDDKKRENLGEGRADMKRRRRLNSAKLVTCNQHIDYMEQ